eukprot:9460238-Alexandrium_andersonii.AAC.1
MPHPRREVSTPTTTATLSTAVVAVAPRRVFSRFARATAIGVAPALLAGTAALSAPGRLAR